MNKEILQRIESTDWDKVTSGIHERGYAIVPGFLSKKQCQQVIGMYEKKVGYRKIVNMERYRFGFGEYKYFDYPLPGIINTIRESVYPKLAPIANVWMEVLKMDRHFPATFHELQEECHAVRQVKATPLILQYGKGGIILFIRIYTEMFIFLCRLYSF